MNQLQPAIEIKPSQPVSLGNPFQDTSSAGHTSAAFDDSHAQKLKVRLQLAYYKLKTNQTELPLNMLAKGQTEPLASDLIFNKRKFAFPATQQHSHAPVTSAAHTAPAMTKSNLVNSAPSSVSVFGPLSAVSSPATQEQTSSHNGHVAVPDISTRELPLLESSTPFVDTNTHRQHRRHGDAARNPEFFAQLPTLSDFSESKRTKRVPLAEVSSNSNTSCSVFNESPSKVRFSKVRSSSLFSDDQIKSSDQIKSDGQTLKNYRVAKNKFDYNYSYGAALKGAARRTTLKNNKNFNVAEAIERLSKLRTKHLAKVDHAAASNAAADDSTISLINSSLVAAATFSSASSSAQSSNKRDTTADHDRTSNTTISFITPIKSLTGNLIAGHADAGNDGSSPSKKNSNTQTPNSIGAAKSLLQLALLNRQ